MTRLVVKSHRPWQFALAIVLLSMIIAIITWLILDGFHWSVIRNRIAAGQELKLLWQAHQGLQEENKDLKARVIMLQRTTDLDQQTALQLQKEIKRLQDDVFVLKGELEFYRGVMEGARAASGLDVHGVYIVPLVQQDSYRLKLVLTHLGKGDKVMTGSLRLSIEGIQHDANRRLQLAELSLDKTSKLEFSVRNFQRIETNIRLPAGFAPQRVLVELQPKSKIEAKINKTFDWAIKGQ